MKKNQNRNLNIIVYAEKDAKSGGMNICLSFSGNREFVTCRCWDKFLYRYLCTGVRLDTLHRMRPKNWAFFGGRHLIPIGQHLVKVIDAYLADREKDEQFDLASVKPLEFDDLFGSIA